MRCMEQKVIQHSKYHDDKKPEQFMWKTKVITKKSLIKEYSIVTNTSNLLISLVFKGFNMAEDLTFQTQEGTRVWRASPERDFCTQDVPDESSSFQPGLASSH
ncbi:hypothetical protein AAES_159406 [Amazona aestiva]|uniref:Uncharacterized protein n=1 Tax=Amazona aestiva TaxID=12930 RepID=A0A0Q3UPW5_AMAAE|nr:hypothetical protein AAES_159406 [Amazona aestiva]